LDYGGARGKYWGGERIRLLLQLIIHSWKCWVCWLRRIRGQNCYRW